MTRKHAISMPDDVYRRLERVRRAQKLSRSAAIQGALDSWLHEHEQACLAEVYVEGYRRIPEEPVEIEAWSAAEAWEPFEDE